MGKEYLYKVGEVVNETLRIVEKVRVKDGKNTRKGYIVQSLIYPKESNYKISESSLKLGTGCAYTSGRRAVKENNLWNIEKIRGNVIDIEEAKNTTPFSNRKLLFKCSNDNCENTKRIVVSSLVKHGYPCSNCSTGISYPERFMLAVNEVYKLNFKYQQTYKYGRFDFVNHTTKTVVEMNGRQHYQDKYSWEDSYEITKVSDDKKRKWCKENNYTLIFIDARKSEFDFIQENINSCEHLPNIKKEDKKVIMEIIEISSKHDIQGMINLYTFDKLTTYQIGKKYNLSDVTIASILKRNNIKLRNGGVLKRAVRCIETNIVYSSGGEASRKTGISQGNINSVCNGKRKTTGGYQWEFVTEE